MRPRRRRLNQMPALAPARPSLVRRGQGCCSPPPPPRKSLVWFDLYLLNVLIITVFDAFFAARGQVVAQPIRLVLFGMNICITSLVVFLFASCFVANTRWNAVDGLVLPGSETREEARGPRAYSGVDGATDGRGTLSAQRPIQTQLVIALRLGAALLDKRIVALASHYLAESRPSIPRKGIDLSGSIAPKTHRST